MPKRLAQLQSTISYPWFYSLLYLFSISIITGYLPDPFVTVSLGNWEHEKKTTSQNLGYYYVITEIVELVISRYNPNFGKNADILI